MAQDGEHIPTPTVVADLHTFVSQQNPSSTSWVLQERGWNTWKLTKVETQHTPLRQQACSLSPCSYTHAEKGLFHLN